jgi:hypothetical protein
VFISTHNFVHELESNIRKETVGGVQGDNGVVVAEEIREERPEMSGGFRKHRRKKDRAERTEGSCGKKGKAVTDKANDPDLGVDMRAGLKLINQLRRELQAAQERYMAGGETSGGARYHAGMGKSGKWKGDMGKNHRHSLSVIEAGKMVEKADPLGWGWMTVRDVPPVEINRLGEPTGAFWEHMQPFLFDRGACVFPWDVNWNRQDPELKSRFLFRLRQLYPGPWEAKVVLTELGNNLREKRNRLKRKFRKYSNRKAVTRPKGCTLQSWEQIYQDLRDPKKKEKSDLCKRKADERVAMGGSPFTHRTGRGGYRAIIAKFVSSLLLYLCSACGCIAYCQTCK